MRKLGVVILALLLPLAAMGITMRTAPVRADSPATVINDVACVLLDGQGVFTVTTDDHLVGTDSKNDNSMTWCKATVLNLSGQTQHWDPTTHPIPCSTGFGLTLRWHETVSPNGEAKLVCEYPTHLNP